jgi:phosphate transport system permease protein
MKPKPATKRKIMDKMIKLISSLGALLGIFFLFWILYIVFQRGASSINWDFFTKLPAPTGVTGGGVANAIVGTFSMTLIASLFGIPVGLLAGVYLSEFGRQNKFGELVRFATNALMGIPSIIIGLFVYAIVVAPMRHFSGWAGAAALAIIIIPVVARTTEDMLSLVPNSLREAVLALGAPRWKMTLGVIFRAAKTGLITGALLAIARVSGETAPLLFTSLNNIYWTKSLNEPTGNLTVSIFNFAMSPYEDWNKIAWGASLLITFAVLFLTLVARAIFREVKHR